MEHALMAAAAGILATLLSPTVTLVALGIVILGPRLRWIIAVAAVLPPILHESLLTAMQVTRVWGEGFPFSIPAALIVAVPAYVLRSRWRKTKPKQ